IAGAALLAGAAFAGYASYRIESVVREQLVRRGQYIARSLAGDSIYGVMTTDQPLLAQLVEIAMVAGGDASGGLSGVVIRGASGRVLAERGDSPAGLPPEHEGESTQFDTRSARGEPVLLFRAPVTAVGSDGSTGAPAGPSTARSIGRVEVALSTRTLRTQRINALWQAGGCGCSLVLLRSLLACFLIPAHAPKAANQVLWYGHPGTA